ncbi:MarR family transcriptional regulator [Alicyclobacillus kakegawensis]|uniref:MarR family transcriptional regulator n=1 Tax=Alicyclobacillus kakegawensis TaxID=392012 RepID=UPI00082A4CDE|nr:MarR family transcriptional regulator [Alicyclobacillus kakegawensis]
MTDMDNDLKKIQDRIKKSLFSIVHRELDDDSDKKWLNEHVSNDDLKRLVPKLSVLSLHTLEIISQNEGIKGTDIARELDVTRGAISKVIRKLLDYGLIRKEQRPTNLREIHLFLTPLGAELSELHRQYHLELDKKGLELLKSYDLSSLELVADFLENLARLH